MFKKFKKIKLPAKIKLSGKIKLSKTVKGTPKSKLKLLIPLILLLLIGTVVFTTIGSFAETNVKDIVNKVTFVKKVQELLPGGEKTEKAANEDQSEKTSKEEGSDKSGEGTEKKESKAMVDEETVVKDIAAYTKENLNAESANVKILSHDTASVDGLDTIKISMEIKSPEISLAGTRIIIYKFISSDKSWEVVKMSDITCTSVNGQAL